MHAMMPILIDAAFKAMVILVMATLLAAAMRRSSAAARHLVWTMAVVSVLSLPALAYVLPGLAVLPSGATAALVDAQPQAQGGAMDDVPNAPPATGDASDAPLAPAPLPARDTASTFSNVAEPGSTTPEAPASHAQPAVSTHATNPDAATIQAGSSSPWTAILDWLPWIWLGGASFALLPVALGAVGLARLKRRSQPITAGPRHRLLTQLREEVGLKRGVMLRRSEHPTMPMTWGGYFALPGLPGVATILLPPDSDEWSADRARAVLLHELAHIKRRDCLTQMLTYLACAVYWFNPLVWYAAQRMLVERERACDDMVLLNETKASDYAEHLLAIATGPPPEVASFFAAHAGITMARRSKLDGRLVAILDQHRNRRALSRVGAALLVAMLGAVVVPVAMLRAEAVADAAAAADAEAQVDAEREADEPAGDDGRAIAELPGGITVELVGVGEHGVDEPAWWRPNGSPLDEAPAAGGTGGRVYAGRGARVRQFAVAYRGLPQGTSTTVNVGPLDGAAQTSSEPGLRVVAAAIRGGVEAAHVHVGLATGAWTTLARVHPGSTQGIAGERGMVAVSPVSQRDDRAAVTLTHMLDPADRALRFAAVDAAGREHTTGWVNASSFDDVAQMTMEFPDLPPDDVMALLVQVRPYHWVEFRDVSLEPGRETEVEIEVRLAEPVEQSLETVGNTLWTRLGELADAAAKEDGEAALQLADEVQRLGEQLAEGIEGTPLEPMVGLGLRQLDALREALKREDYVQAARIADRLRMLVEQAAERYEAGAGEESPEPGVEAVRAGEAPSAPAAALDEQRVELLERRIALQRQRVERAEQLMEIGRAPADEVAEMVLELGELELRLAEVKAQGGDAAEEADDAPSALELRLMAGADTLVLMRRLGVELGEELDDDAAVAQLRRLLAERGPEAVGRSDAPFAWLPVGAGAEIDERAMITAEHEGRTYLLVANQPPLAMRGLGGVWRVEAAGLTEDHAGRAAVAIELDEQAGAVLHRLTRVFVGEPLAMVVEGEVVAAPTLQSAIGAELRITGRGMDNEQMQRLVGQLGGRGGAGERSAATALARLEGRKSLVVREGQGWERMWEHRALRPAQREQVQANIEAVWEAQTQARQRLTVFAQSVRRAEDLVAELEDGRFEEARAHFDERMLAALSAEALAQLWSQLEGAGGEYAGAGEASYRREGDHDAIYVPLRWARNAVNLKIVFDDEAQVAGLWTLPPRAGEDDREGDEGEGEAAGLLEPAAAVLALDVPDGADGGAGGS